jgi:signal transduction histidine kinase
MNIRTRLTLIFFSIVIVVLTAICFSIYIFSAEFRKEDFQRRLRNRAINTAKLLVEVDEVNADLLRRMERNNPASLPNQYIIIFNYRNQIVYSSENARKIPIDTTLLNNIRLKKSIEFKYKDFEVLGFMHTSEYDRYTIVAAATDVYGIDALYNLRNILLITILLSLVFVSLLGWLFAGRVLTPISRIVDDVDKITELNLNRRLDEGKNNDELNKLARTFNRMLQRLQNAFTAQKTFIANASHEIKTPITIMSGEIEVTLLHDREKEYYVKVLRSVLQGLRGLNKLSTQLLVLAQTNSEQPMRNARPIRIDDILWETKDELMKLHPDYTIEVDLAPDIDHELLSIAGDEQLLKVAIMNLMDNGCKHSDDKRIMITVSGRRDDKVLIDFVNRGPGVPPEMADKIFDPFFRANASKKVKGFGIGLSLVRRIITLHKGKISVESIPHQTTSFQVELPSAVNPPTLISI